MSEEDFDIDYHASQGRRGMGAAVWIVIAWCAFAGSFTAVMTWNATVWILRRIVE